MNNNHKKKQQHDLSATTLSVKAALTANRQLQAQLARELARILERKRQNRIDASTCLKQLYSTTSQQQLQNAIPEGNKSKSPSVAQVTALIPKDPPITVKRRQTFRYDPNRKWTLAFWTDPTGSSPEENEDTKKRRTLEPLVTTAGAAPTKAANTKTRPFSKEESNFIVEQQQQQQQDPDWHEIATRLNDRTAFECLQHYHRMQKKKKKKTATTPEITPSTQSEEVVDATLLHYLALQGPQFVWDLPSSAHSSGLIGGGKYSHKQLRIKANTTQTVNPNYTTTAAAAATTTASSTSLKNFWELDDQRKLVLAMKVYSSDNQTYPTPVQLASMHFPHRPTSYVTKKWERTLNTTTKKKQKTTTTTAQQSVEPNGSSSSEEE